MISVIMPTMWKGKSVWKAIREIIMQESVGELILIDNSEEGNGNKTFARNFGKGLVYIDEGKNTYVNPAWNKGVKLAKFDKLLFVNDDVETDWSFVNNLEEYITEDRGMIGAGVSCWQGPHNHSGVVPIGNRPNCYGCVFAMHKNSYVEIPDDLKIHYGDDWLFTKSGKPNYEIRGWKMGGESEQTSGRAEFNPIKETDKHLWMSKYQN
jgi:GT2 family glycosyltransferase